nr:MAG TPA: hypothetical protein [Caudoviricetes sp.]
MVKKLLTQIKHKTLTGEEVVMDIGAKASNVLPENFVEQKERSNLAAKDKLPVIFGKLSKWYTDLKAVAWSGSYLDLTNKPSIPEGSAANYQVANNDTTEAEGFVADARIVRTHGLEIDGLSRDLHALNDSGAIKGMDAREDGVYITYVPTSGADAVTKKLGDALESTDGVVLMIHNHMNAKDSFQCMFNKEYIGQNSTSVRKFDVLRSGAYTYVFTHSPTGGSGSVSKILVNDKQIDYMEFISGPKSKSGSISLNTGDTVELVTGSYNSGHITNASMILRFQ